MESIFWFVLKEPSTLQAEQFREFSVCISELIGARFINK